VTAESDRHSAQLGNETRAQSDFLKPRGRHLAGQLGRNGPLRLTQIACTCAVSGIRVLASKLDSVATWKHFNLHGKFDFSDERMADSIGLAAPKNLQLWNEGLCQIIIFVVSIALIYIAFNWNQGFCQITVLVVSIALIHIAFNWNQGLCQIIVFVVSIDRIRIDVNSSGWCWLIKISILECTKGLNLIVSG